MTTDEALAETPPPLTSNIHAIAGDDLYYLATPYSRAPAGQEHAYRIACIIAARLIERGVPVYSPIAHGHPIATVGNLPGHANYWSTINDTILRGCEGLIVAMSPGWAESEGIADEIVLAERLGLVIWYLAPDGVLFSAPPTFELGEAA